MRIFEVYYLETNKLNNSKLRNKQKMVNTKNILRIPFLNIYFHILITFNIYGWLHGTYLEIQILEYSDKGISNITFM